nr:dienelactone hydrolase family protein [Massilia sp. IC2-477]
MIVKTCRKTARSRRFTTFHGPVWNGCVHSVLPKPSREGAEVNSTIDIAVADGSFSAYVARPAQDIAPAVVIIQEIFGVNEGIRSIAADMAEQGFIAVCPDLFWRSERNLSMSESNPSHQERGFALYRAYDFDQGVGDIAATIAAARQLPQCSGKVGVMGYCLGGLLTFLTAATGTADAAVAYYGGGTDRFLDRAPGIKTPLLMHLAGDDEYIGPDAQAAIRQAVANRPEVQVHLYPGRQHAFARPGGVHYDREAAELANGRTREFMRRHLG